MSSQQETIGNSAPEDRKVRCYVKCTSNKVDRAKGDIRSINFNFDLRDEDDKMIGTGNNLNINNITPAAYAKMCAAFGVDEITPETPFYAELVTVFTQEKRIAWQAAMSRKEKKIDKKQADITKPPKGKGKAKDEEEDKSITEKQVSYINDKFVGKNEKFDKKIKSYLKKLKLKDITEMDKHQATELIHGLKEMEEELAKKSDK